MEEINNIDLNLCKSFLVVAKYKSISKAAEILAGEGLSGRRTSGNSISWKLQYPIILFSYSEAAEI